MVVTIRFSVVRARPIFAISKRKRAEGKAKKKKIKTPPPSFRFVRARACVCNIKLYLYRFPGYNDGGPRTTTLPGRRYVPWYRSDFDAAYHRLRRWRSFAVPRLTRASTQVAVATTMDYNNGEKGKPICSSVDFLSRSSRTSIWRETSSIPLSTIRLAVRFALPTAA